MGVKQNTHKPVIVTDWRPRPAGQHWKTSVINNMAADKGGRMFVSMTDWSLPTMESMFVIIHCEIWGTKLNLFYY